MSDQAVGANSRIIYGLEDSLGAGAAAPNGLVLYYKGGESFGAETAEIDSDTIRNNPNPTESASGDTTVKGGFQFELAWQYALLLAAHFGGITSSPAASAVKAFKGTLATGYDAVIEATTAGVAGNLITVALAGDSTPTVRITRDGTAFTIAYQSGTSTVADVNAAITALAGADDLIGVKTAGTGATVLTAPASNCAATALTGGNDGIYTEVFKIDTVSDSLWFEKGFTDLATPGYLLSRGHRIPKYSYEKKASGFVGCSFDMPGLNDADYAEATIDETPIDLGHHPFNAKGGTILIDTVDVGTITSAKFDSDRNAKPSEPVIGSGGYSTQFPVGKATVKGNITTLFDSVAIYDKARARDVVAIKLTDQNGNGTGAAGHEYIEHYFAETHLARVDPTIKGDDGVIIDFPFTAFLKDSAGNSACTVTVKHSSTVLHDLIALLA